MYGNNLNPGTKAQPLANMEGARDLIRQLRKSVHLNEEVRVMVGNGMYFMTEPLLLTDQDSGTEAFPIIFRAEEGANPVFIGGISIKNWEKVTDKVWKAKIQEVNRFGFYFEQLYINGQRATRAKSPNQGFTELPNGRSWPILIRFWLRNLMKRLEDLKNNFKMERLTNTAGCFWTHQNS